MRTYAPVGQTPVLREQLTRDHLSVISGITLEGKLYMIDQERGPSRVRTWGSLLEARLAADPGQVVGDLGWLTDP